ncbi:hypothetical protein V9K67_25115 [Paraflavisolibacter sp. H34]|uniref:hypothetical protein n=1 Tax=Huijunlia imazamoxiresistens TaxID=3127457 RepID=UPI00301A5AA2
MNWKLTRMALGVLMIGSLFTACKKDKDEPEENEEELITTLKLTFVPVGGGATATYQFRDPDGAGGVAPTQDGIVLAPSKTYNVTVQLLNESKTPAEDITTEVQEEPQAHRFYYQPSAGSNITVSGLNTDAAGAPLGITSTWTTGAAATGSVAVTLRHYGGNPPGKAAADPVNSPKSSTDIDVTFTTRVQ